MINSTYQVGDIISVLVNRLPNKPEFLRTGSALRLVDASAKSEKYKETKYEKSQKRPNEFVGAEAAVPDMQEADLKNLEVSDGSFIEFYKNGVKKA